jgi:uncharacterized RDD family membrane protein YckC
MHDAVQPGTTAAVFDPATSDSGTSHAPDPRALLTEYRAVLAEVERLHLVRLLRRRRGKLGFVLRAPRLRAFVRFFVIYHLTRSVTALQRLYQCGAALSPDDESYERGAKQVDAFAKFLPPYRPRRMLLILAVSIFFGSFLLARDVVGSWNPAPSFLVGVHGGTFSETAGPLGNIMRASVTPTPEKLGDALQSFVCASKTSNGKWTKCSAGRGFATTVASLILLGTVIWLVTALPVTSFRLKRMLFDLRPAGAEAVGGAFAIDHAATASGLYRQEARLFRALGARPPRETPFDLLSEASVLVLPIWVSILVALEAIYGIRYVTRWGVNAGDLTAIVLFFYGAALLFMLPAARLVFLRRTYRRRLADALKLDKLTSSDTTASADWTRRVAAYAIDLISAGVIGVVFAALVWSRIADHEARELTIIIAGPIIGSAVYEALFLFRSGDHASQSFGKEHLGLRVVRSDHQPVTRPRLFFRNVGLRAFIFAPSILSMAWFAYGFDPVLSVFFIVPALACALDYLCPLGHHDKCALHDLVADTVVVQEARAPEAARAGLVP